MARERVPGGSRRGTRKKRRALWLGAGALLIGGLLVLGVVGGPGGPPRSRPPGAGLPPAAIPYPSLAGDFDPAAAGRAAEAAAARTAEVAEEEARLAALRSTRARLESEIATLRAEAEERRRAMPGRKDVPGNLAAGPSPAGGAIAGGGPAGAGTLAAAAVEEPPSRSVRVFVHHRANSPPGANAAAEVADTLRGAGVEVPAVRAAPFVPSTPVVRYFHDEDQAAAARLAGRLGRGWAIQDFRAFVPQPPPQTLEVWLPAN